MYTRCPHCETWFTIGAAQLRLGRGEVQCGTCFETFDALATLADAPSAESPPRLAAGPVTRFEVPDAPDPVDGDAEPAARATPPIGDMALLAARPARDENGRPVEPEAGSLPVIDEESNGRAHRAAGGAPVVDLEALPPVLPEPAEPDAAVAPVAPTGPRLAGEFERVPDVLWEDMARLAAARMARRLRSIYFVAGALLLVGLVAQYAWFLPDDLLRRYPSARPWVATFCARTGCALPEQRDLRRIRMLSRDVRIHPEYEGALQVTASLVNSAPFVQAYPRIQFTLFNVNGQTIATRVFGPAEYAGADVDIARGMPSDSPVQIVLDLVAPEQVAVSFEFRFI